MNRPRGLESEHAPGRESGPTAEPERLHRCCQRLMEQHAEIDAMLERHQVALVERRYDDARAAFDSFRTALLDHMAAEEADVMPAYERTQPLAAAGAPELMKAEHRQVRLLLGELDRLVLTVGAGEHLTPRVVIGLIEEERRLKGVLEHHHCRDQRYLYPCAQTPPSCGEGRA